MADDNAARPPQAKIETLPQEILGQILSNIVDISVARRDGGTSHGLAPLSFTRKSLRAQCIPALFETITVRGESHEAAHKINTGSKLASVHEHLKHTKILNIHFRDPGFTPKSQPILADIDPSKLQQIARKQRIAFFRSLTTLLRLTPDLETLSFDLYTNKELDCLQQTRECLDHLILSLVDFRDKLPKLRTLKTYQSRRPSDRETRTMGLDVRKELAQIFGANIEKFHVAGVPFVGADSPLLTDYITRATNLTDLRVETYWRPSMVEDIAKTAPNLKSLGMAGWYANQRGRPLNADDVKLYVQQWRYLPALDRLELPRLTFESRDEEEAKGKLEALAREEGQWVVKYMKNVKVVEWKGFAWFKSGSQDVMMKRFRLELERGELYDPQGEYGNVVITINDEVHWKARSVRNFDRSILGKTPE